MLTLVVVLSTFATVTHGFLPTYNPKLLMDDPDAFYTTKTHNQITQDAHTDVVDSVVDASSQYDTDVLREASGQFLQGVEEIDSPLRPYRAEEHVDSEKINGSHNLLRTLSRSIRDDIRAERMDEARRKTGNALHTLQDFYSHSNWIEMGNTAPHPQFGRDDRLLVDNIAGPYDKTCKNCIVEPNRDCVGNSEPADSHGILTSGYFSTISSNENQRFKPSDKCSCGGLDDKTGINEPPLGGINKDTRSPSWSPHSGFHAQGAATAQEASIQYIRNIRDQADQSSPISQEQFEEFLGIVNSYTLCFVVDTTGSMSEEISAVREATIKLVNDSSFGERKPSDYVLVPFNDPEFGPSMKTKDPNQMIRWLRNLTAFGGGDTPEMSMNGILLAIQAVRQSSTCLVYTDAPAKDVDLLPIVQAQALEKKVKLDFVYTDVGVGRKKRSTKGQSLLKRQKRSPYTYYDDLAKATGGLVLELTGSTIRSATEAVVAIGSRAQQVTVFAAGSVSGQFQFYVDSTLESIVLQLAGYANVSVFRTPGGNPFTNYTTLSSTTKAKLYSLGKLTPGLWTVTLSGVADSVTVTASSPVNFDYKFSTVSDASRGGFVQISGMPIADSNYYVLTNVYGGMDRTSGGSTRVANMTSVMFIAPNGTILTTLPLTQLAPLKAYVTNTVKMKRAAFQVVLNGFDTRGNLLRRYDRSVVTPALTSVLLEIKNSTLKMLPGSSVVACINVTNSGSPATWYIRISDTERYYRGITPISVYLITGESDIQCMNFSSPANAAFGQVSTVTVTVGGLSTTSVDNYLVFYMTTDDTLPPSLNDSTLNPVEECVTVNKNNCETRNWAVRVAMNDAESGLLSAAAQPVSTSTGGTLPDDGKHTFTVDSFNVSTKSVVMATYQATCCRKTAIVRAMDVSGNVNEVVIGKPVQAEPNEAAQIKLLGPFTTIVAVAVSSLLLQLHRSVLPAE